MKKPSVNHSADPVAAGFTTYFDAYVDAYRYILCSYTNIMHRFRFTEFIASAFKF